MKRSEAIKKLSDHLKKNKFPNFKSVDAKRLLDFIELDLEMIPRGWAVQGDYMDSPSVYHRDWEKE